VDEAVGALDVARVLLALGGARRRDAHHGVVEEGLAHVTAVGELVALEGGLVAADGADGDLAGNDVVLEDVGGELALELREGGVGRHEDGQRARALEGRGEAGLLDGGDEGAEVVVALDVGLLLADGRAVSAPVDNRALEGGDGGDDVRRHDHVGHRRAGLHTRRSHADLEARADREAADHHHGAGPTGAGRAGCGQRWGRGGWARPGAASE